MKRAFPLILIAAATIATGCAHNGPKSVASIQDEINHWKSGSTNPLLAYVPDTTPFVIATQRAPEGNIQALLKRIMPIFYMSIQSNIEDAIEFQQDYLDHERNCSAYRENYAGVNSSGGFDPQETIQIIETSCKAENTFKREKKVEFDAWKKECATNITIASAQKMLDQSKCDDPQYANTCGCKTVSAFKNYDDDDYILQKLNIALAEYAKENQQQYELLELLNSSNDGSNPLIQTDAVLYFAGSNPVIKLAVKDETMLSRLNTVLLDACNTDDDHTSKTMTVDNHTWTLCKDHNYYQIILNTENNIITASVVYNNIIPDLHTPAVSPIKLQSSSPNSVLESRLSYDKLTTLLSNPFIAQMLDAFYIEEFEYGDVERKYNEWKNRREDLTQLTQNENYATQFRENVGITSFADTACINEIPLFFENYKNLESSLTIDSNGLLSLSMNQKLTSDYYKTIESYVESYPDYRRIDQVAYLAIGADISKSYKFTLDQYKKILNRNYQCSQSRTYVDSLSSTFERLKYIPSSVLLFIEGMHTQYYSLLAVDESTNNIHAFAHIQNDNIRSSLGILAKDELGIDLVENEMMSLKKMNLSALWKGKDLLIGFGSVALESAYELQQNDKASQQNDKTIFELNVTQKIIRSIAQYDIDLQKAKDIFENIKISMKLNKESLDFNFTEYK